MALLWTGGMQDEAEVKFRENKWNSETQRQHADFLLRQRKWTASLSWENINYGLFHKVGQSKKQQDSGRGETHK